MSEPFNLEIWRKIHAAVSRNPGMEIEKIADLLNMKIDQAEIYIRSMTEHKEINESKEGNVIRYYVGESSLLSQQDRRASDTRIRLYSLIMQNPGLHLSKIADVLEMSSPLAEYHLSYLEKNSYIMSVPDEKGYYKRFYVASSEVGREDKKQLALLRQEQLLKIVLLLIKHQVLRHKEISEKLKISPSTLSYHLNKLVEQGIIEVATFGEEKGYTLKNSREITWMVRRYKLDQIIEGFKNTWSDLEL